MTYICNFIKVITKVRNWSNNRHTTHLSKLPHPYCSAVEAYHTTYNKAFSHFESKLQQFIFNSAHTIGRLLIIAPVDIILDADFFNEDLLFFLVLFLDFIQIVTLFIKDRRQVIHKISFPAAENRLGYIILF